jgi:capsular polysaccharide biosynthesis protein
MRRSVDSTDNSLRRSFVREVAKILRSTDRLLDTERIAQLGRASGALIGREIAEIESKSQLPVWLKEELGLTEPFCPSGRFEVLTVFSARLMKCPPPQVVRAEFLPDGFQRATGSAPAVSVVSGVQGTFLLQNFLQASFVNDGYIPPMTAVANLWGWQVVRERRPVHLRGRTLICVVEGSAVFTHWMLDTLPRLRALEECGIDHRAFDNILFAATDFRFCAESLAVLGVDVNKVRARRDVGVLVSCDEFWHVTAVRNQFFADDWLYQFVNKTFKERGVRSESNRRIYISRSLAQRRKVLNETQLYPVLERYGFEVIHAETLGLRAMATLCSQASHVVAPHGAGLSNIVFVPQGGKVLELFGPHLSTEYWRICSALGHSYFCLQGIDDERRPFTKEQVDSLTFFERNARSFHVEVDTFTMALDILMGD